MKIKMCEIKDHPNTYIFCMYVLHVVIIIYCCALNNLRRRVLTRGMV